MTYQHLIRLHNKDFQVEAYQKISRSHNIFSKKGEGKKITTSIGTPLMRINCLTNQGWDEKLIEIIEKRVMEETDKILINTLDPQIINPYFLQEIYRYYPEKTRNCNLFVTQKIITPKNWLENYLELEGELITHSYDDETTIINPKIIDQQYPNLISKTTDPWYQQTGINGIKSFLPHLPPGEILVNGRQEKIKNLLQIEIKSEGTLPTPEEIWWRSNQNQDWEKVPFPILCYQRPIDGSFKINECNEEYYILAYNPNPRGQEIYQLLESLIVTEPEERTLVIEQLKKEFIEWYSTRYQQPVIDEKTLIQLTKILNEKQWTLVYDGKELKTNNKPIEII